MKSRNSFLFFAVQNLAILFTVGCSTHQVTSSGTSEKLQTIRIQEARLAGTPNHIVSQLNRLSKKYDLPTHEGVAISFDPSVDPYSCQMTIFRQGEPLANWVQNVCESCGSKYRVVGNKVLIELLPLSEKRTSSLEAQLTNGMAQTCSAFRSKKGRERYALGEEIFLLLPRSPITSSRETPGHFFVSYDHEHPSYTLYKRDILTLLGGARQKCE